MSREPTDDAPDEAPKSAEERAISSTVYRLGVVSLLTDIAGDLVSTLLPFFLVGTLGASLGVVGLIDGTADALSSVLKIVAGRLGDGRIKKKRLVLVGYGIAALVRPLIALAASPIHVLLIRIVDRMGKGIRSAPRDAWIADVTPPEQRGRAYGVHRSLDNAGAFLGPVLGLFLYRGLHLPLETVFLATIIPGVLAVALLVTTKEAPPVAPQMHDETPDVPPSGGLPPTLRTFLVVLFVFALASSSDTFILLLGRSLGIDDALVLGTWIGFAALRTLLTRPGSALSDRIGRKPSLLLGWSLYACLYFAFSFVGSYLAWASVLAVYAGYYALTEGAERALVADLAPPSQRGRAFGWFHGTIGLALLPASWAFGALGDAFDLATAFRVSGGLALAAAIALALVVRATPKAPVITG